MWEECGRLFGSSGKTFGFVCQHKLTSVHVDLHSGQRVDQGNTVRPCCLRCFCAEDAIEFLLAGASAVAVGAMNFVNPYTTVEVVEGIKKYMERYGVEDIRELIGAVS